MMQRILRYALFIAVAQGVGIAGTYFTADAIPTWYASLEKPFFAPPNWLFAPVWTSLYLLMGIAGARAWELRAFKKGASRGLKWYWIQLALNALWTPVFFGMKNIGFALVVIVFLWIAILMTMREFWKAEKGIAVLLLPYLIWVSFATALNAAFFVLN